uniref:ZP domain-containing protein n=1 Tax=Periophthalmus magnuspinnatus TaxID=409849 RepID=A0A3B4A4N6_9GOBI
NSDLTVDCSATVITLEINLCTAQWAGFNTTDLALNGNHNKQECLGTADTSVSPPVMRYYLPVNHSHDNPCRQSLQFQIVDEAPDPSGPFSSFASVQSVIITSFIETPRSDQGTISYSTDLYYHFSCRYPLEYLINNTQIVSSVSVATNDNNGTFINTIKMSVYNQDSSYQYPLIVPPTGLPLRAGVFAEVKAVNLTGFYVLLDHCFSTPTAYNVTHSEQHIFFTCSKDDRTTVISNGISKVARFNFEAFRFLQHRAQSMSSIYLHCILRLCEPNKCQEILAGCNSKRKRSVTPFGQEDKDSATVSAGPLYTAAEETGLIVGVVLGSAVAVLLVLSGWFALKRFY